MKILTSLAIILFYLQHLIIMLIVTLLNSLNYIYKVLTNTNSQKHPLLPHQLTHQHVFSHTYDFVSKQGYALQVFRFQTSDKVSVEMWRIYRKDLPLKKPYPVLLMHGLLDCSTSWFLHIDKSKSLPYILASEGYEVWVGNNRGNRISQKQESSDEKYWDYSLDHLVDFDQPAIIQGVLKRSKKQKLIYIGHSQGSAQFILGMGVHHHLQEKIACFIGLGTAVSLQNTKNHTILKVVDKLKLMELCNFLGLKRILVLSKLFSKTVGVLVYNSKIHSRLIMFFIRMLCGFSSKNKISQEYFGVMLTHQPGGASPNNILQWVNCHRSGVMKRFDFGRQKNMEVYGQQEPQTYCLKHLGYLPFKSYLFRGSKDAVMPQSNFKQLLQRFNPQKVHSYEVQDYHHLQYLWSQTAHNDIYPQIREIVNSTSAQ